MHYYFWIVMLNFIMGVYSTMAGCFKTQNKYALVKFVCLETRLLLIGLSVSRAIVTLLRIENIA